MPKFMFVADYKTKGTHGLIEEGGTGRRATVKGLIESIGGKLESFYYVYGDADAYLVADLPDASSAIALSLAVNQSGAVTLRTMPLISAEELDAAAKKVPAYRAPGEAKKGSKKR